VILIKPFEALESRYIAAIVAGFSHCSEQPEGLFFVATVNEHYESHYKVHGLAVAHLVIVDRENLKRVH
jgi:hypothetical protein